MKFSNSKDTYIIFFLYIFNIDIVLKKFFAQQ